MEKIFVNKAVKVKAPASKVWNVLTKREHNDKWALEFSSGGPQFHIESDWKLGNPVLWKGQDDSVIVEGNVTAVEPNKFLRFTVRDVRMKEKVLVAKEDGITFDLTEQDGITILHVSQGDFAAIPEGKKYARLTSETWDRVLPKIKELAERKN